MKMSLEESLNEICKAVNVPDIDSLEKFTEDLMFSISEYKIIKSHLRYETKQNN